MTSADRLRRLFDYDAWACREVHLKLENQEDFESRKEAMRLMGHILSSQQIWHRRISNKSFEDLELWPELSVEDCRSLLSAMSKKWQALIEVHEQDLDHLVAYENTKGQSFETMLSDILHHVIIHGQHHRAQIATLFRKSGIQPPVTDFIFYTREITSNT